MGKSALHAGSRQAWVPVLTFSLPRCVVLGNLLYRFGSSFSNLQNGDRIVMSVSQS